MLAGSNYVSKPTAEDMLGSSARRAQRRLNTALATARMPHPSEPGAPLDSSQLLAWALYDIRLLLSSHIGGASQSSPYVRAAAELAYALHNLALAEMQGDAFSEASFLKGLARAEHACGEPFVSRYNATIRGRG